MNSLKWLFVLFLCFFLVSACIPEGKWSGPGAIEHRDGPGSEHIVNLEVPEDPEEQGLPVENPQYQDGESVYVDLLIYVYDEKEIKVEQIQPSITDLGPGETWSFEAIITASNASTYDIIEIYGY